MRVNTKGLTATWYEPTVNNDTKPKAKVKIEPLTSLQVMEIQDHMSRGEGRDTIRISAHGRRLLLEYGVSGWSNFKTEKGKSLAFSIENLLLLPPEVLTDIAFRVYERSTVPEEEDKD